jgi:hypothetical protein
MIPEFIDVGGPWKVLPPGVHSATLDEVESRFARSKHRKDLFRGFKKGALALCEVGCQTIFLDGSFVTAKPHPGDFDACWDTTGVDDSKLDPVFLDLADGRKKQKKRFSGEFFPAGLHADTRHVFIDFFQMDKYTGNAKGIISISFTAGTPKGDS